MHKITILRPIQGRSSLVFLIEEVLRSGREKTVLVYIYEEDGDTVYKANVFMEFRGDRTVAIVVRWVEAECERRKCEPYVSWYGPSSELFLFLKEGTKEKLGLHAIKDFVRQQTTTVEHRNVFSALDAIAFSERSEVWVQKEHLRVRAVGRVRRIRYKPKDDPNQPKLF